MKSSPYLVTSVVALFLLSFAFSFDGCSDKCRVKSKFNFYSPVYSTTAEIKAQAGMKEARDVKSPGRIYVKGSTLFVNERGEGIHIFDNHDPAHPVAIGFLNVPGNIDLAVEGNTLYADSYVDLVAFDITDIHQIKEVKRLEGLFNSYTTYGFGIDPQKGIVTSWKAEQNVVIEETECDVQLQTWGGIYYADGIGINSMSPLASSMSAIPVATHGVGGSTARFAIAGHFLYGLDGSQMEVVDVSSETSPVSKPAITVAWDAETLFPRGSNLFVGARAGMYIFDLTTPESPQLLGTYDHIQSCDPVVVEGNLAYVTLYSGGACHVVTNQLEVIDITNVRSPQLISVFPMTNPHGLAIDEGILFICDGDSGLKIYDAHDPLTIGQHLLAHYDSINAQDVILLNTVAIMIGNDGIYQYDYTDLNSVKPLSQIPIVKL